MSKYITSDPNILSGMPVITGTRVPVARILSLLKEGYTLEEIHKQFDHISINTLEGTLAEVAAMINNTPLWHTGYINTNCFWMKGFHPVPTFHSLTSDLISST